MPPSPSIKMEPRQVMAFALHQSLSILQMPQLELAKWLEGEIANNPLYEEPPLRGGRATATGNDPQAAFSLRDHLLAQARERFASLVEFRLAESLIDRLDERGWLTTPIEELGEREAVLRILSAVQAFDPAGIGARNLRESYLLQLRRQPYSLAELLVRERFEDLLRGRFARIQKELCLAPADLQQALHTLSRLPMHPASSFHVPCASPLVCDLSIRERDDAWVVEVGEEELPPLAINSEYFAIYRTLSAGEEKETMRGWITGARWLHRSLRRRRETLFKIGDLLIRTQRPFLEQTGAITPIPIRDLAAYLGVHESTAWRAAAHKIVGCPQGLVPLGRFFLDSASMEQAKELVAALIAQEDKRNPLTDEEIADQLAARGVSCARRTVAKYRKLLNLASARFRSCCR